ncbi:unnamed protein product [Clonostachys solani]|uniref:Uncharacterized protein n=1 Tax=Clonostachys solani TaxID=160281 RepID=A0A9N9YSL0_9HYPO|nr:unnamed protein product [Clonostachys solani]
METAKCILDPLSDMPPLRDVAINLGHFLTGIEDSDSRSFIRNAAKGLLGENIKKSPFRFMSLPLELQIQILQQTPLVADENVHFRPNQVYRPGNFRKTCSMKRLYPKYGEDRLSQPMASTASFCSWEYPNAFSQHCECDNFPPEAYFQVSKDFSYIARHVFYSSNRLCFPPVKRNGRYRIATDGGHHLTLPPFLRRIPLESLWSLRNLCVIFPPCSPDYLLPDEPDWHAWVESIQRLSHLADLSRLRLEVHFGDLYSVPSVSGLLFDFYSENQNNMIINHTSAWGRSDESMKMKKAILNTYKRMLEPLKKLDCKLLSLQVYLSWSLLDIGHEERKGYERSLEKMIMGDEYDSAKSGKRARSEFI